MTVITQPAAVRRFHQGLNYLLGTTKEGSATADAESFLAIVTVMAYLAAYAFPDGNLYDVKHEMIAALDPLNGSADIDATVDHALRLAEVFRRPWSEPSGSSERTI